MKALRQTKSPASKVKKTNKRLLTKLKASKTRSPNLQVSQKKSNQRSKTVAKFLSKRVLLKVLRSYLLKQMSSQGRRMTKA